jgi:hypothetical protein
MASFRSKSAWGPEGKLAAALVFAKSFDAFEVERGYLASAAVGWAGTAYHELANLRPCRKFAAPGRAAHRESSDRLIHRGVS